RVAFLSDSCIFSILKILQLSHLRDQTTQLGSVVLPFELGAGQQHVKQFIVPHLEQLSEGLHVGISKLVFELIKKLRDDQVVFEQAAPGSPTQARAVDLRLFLHWAAALNSATDQELFDLANGLAGLSPFGQTSVQFMMVWQRNRR